MGYSRQHNTICSSVMLAGMEAGVGAHGCDPREFAESDLIIVWDQPVYTQVNLMTHISRACKERGAKLIVIDPYRTPTARQADVHPAAPRHRRGACLREGTSCFAMVCRPWVRRNSLTTRMRWKRVQAETRHGYRVHRRAGRGD